MGTVSLSRAGITKFTPTTWNQTQTRQGFLHNQHKAGRERLTHITSSPHVWAAPQDTSPGELAQNRSGTQSRAADYVPGSISFETRAWFEWA